MSAPLDISQTPSLPTRLRELRDSLLTGLVERDVAIRLALIAALSGEHLLLLGPPGTAKSLVAHRLQLAFSGATYFERLLTRFSVPEELFGPLSIKGLEEDRYERQTAGYLPTASIAFLDEIFKANSAILNSLLTLLNEREFDNGSKRVKTPLIAVIGASNELPDGEELDALFDRFLLRLHVGPVSKEAFPALLGLRGDSKPRVPHSLKLTAAELAEVQELAECIDVPADVLLMLCELREWCAAEKIAVSDRRWRKIVKLLQVSALTNERHRVSVWDCWLLQHCLWTAPEDREKISAWYAGRVGASAAMDPSNLTRIVAVFETRLRRDAEQRSQMRDDTGRPLFVGLKGATTDEKEPEQKKRGSEPLFLAPPNAFANYHRQTPIARDKAGAGYTEAELNELYLTHSTQFAHWPDRAQYLTSRDNWLVIDRVLPPAMEPTRHKLPHVKWCSAEVARYRDEVVEYQRGLANRIVSVDAEVRSHLWVLSEFAEPALVALRETAAKVETLLHRLDAVGKGIELLPFEPVPAELTEAAAESVTPQKVTFVQALVGASEGA